MRHELAFFDQNLEWCHELECCLIFFKEFNTDIFVDFVGQDRMILWTLSLSSWAFGAMSIDKSNSLRIYTNMCCTSTRLVTFQRYRSKAQPLLPSQVWRDLSFFYFSPHFCIRQLLVDFLRFGFDSVQHVHQFCVVKQGSLRVCKSFEQLLIELLQDLCDFRNISNNNVSNTSR